MSQINFANYMQMNRSIEFILSENGTDGTIKENDEIVHKLNAGHIYDVYMIDCQGFPNMIGTYVFEKIDGEQYVLKRVDWIINVNYNMLLLPFMLADRYIFGSRMDQSIITRAVAD